MLRLPELRVKAYKDSLERYVRLVLKEAGVVGLILHGSLAKGLEKPYPESDIDLIVVAEGIPKDLFERRMMASRIKGDGSLVEDIWITLRSSWKELEEAGGVVLDALADG